MIARISLCIAVLSIACGPQDAGVVSPGGDSEGHELADSGGPSDLADSDPGVTADSDPGGDAGMDVGGPAPCEPGDGCFGEACGDPDDCLSGICTMHMGEKVCSRTCDTTCPDGFTCTLVARSADGQYVCVSDFSHLCLPCVSPEGCMGDVPHACVKYPEGHTFCGGTCDADNPCPEGFQCQMTETTTGGVSQQCVLGEALCPCSSLAIVSSLATSCETTNDSGSCTGVRVCTEEGLSDCSAADPADDTCNGVDDDCDGLLDEENCDDGNACTEDSCLGEDGCQHQPLEGAACSDGSSCTTQDHCEAAACVGTPLECDDDNPCTGDTCDPEKGCINIPNFGDCTDGDLCTLGDTCKDGACVPGTALACDDSNPCTDDACSDSGCIQTPNQVECDDGNACTTVSQCDGGNCAGLEATACDDGNACTTDGCDPVAGCTAIENSLPCDDADTCTLGDICSAGACQPGLNPLPCADGNPCTDDGCDTSLGCVFVANTDPCDDKNECTASDTCVEAACIGSGNLACDDGNACTLDTCLDQGGCNHKVLEGGCDDGDPCTSGDACLEGGCQSGSVIACDDGNPCTDEACDDGNCQFAPNDVGCDDGNACTTGEVCQGGACKAAGMLDCDDANPCTDDACDINGGCVTQPNIAPCDDGDSCTIGDNCQAGACASGATLFCDDNNVCTDDSCQDGSCLFEPNAALCDDGNACTTGDGCLGGSCKSDGILACSDANVCTDDSCDVKTGCIATANDDACDDGDACTLGDLCNDGDCESGETPLPCDDDLFCNGTEVCDVSEGCLSGAPPELDDGVACTQDLCDEDTQSVLHLPDDAACAGGGLCVLDTCDPLEGCQSAVAPDCCGNGLLEVGEDCDDGNLDEDDLCDNLCKKAKIGTVADPGLSCHDILLKGGSQGDGTYWIRPDTDFPPFEIFCDMTRDGGGWGLVGAVHRADVSDVDEPSNWFSAGNNPEALKTNIDTLNASPSGLGTARFEERVGALRHAARFDLHAQNDWDTRVTWFKDATPEAYPNWFLDNDVPTSVCLDPLLTQDCESGTIRSSGTTQLQGMQLSDHGWEGGEIHMRQNSDGSPHFSAVCSSSGGGDWPDDAIDGQWGNGLRIWLKESLCGNGAQELGEDCDDGNDDPDDGCASDCKSPLGACPSTPKWKMVWSHPLDSAPPGAIIQHGGWNSQGPANVAGKSCWRQMSDWNILWIPHPSSDESRYAVEVSSYRPSNPAQISGYFAANTEKTGYNGTVNAVQMSTQKGNEHLNLDTSPDGEAVTIDGAATRDNWHVWRVEIDKPTQKAAFFQDGVFMGCLDSPPATHGGAKIKLGSNGIAYQVAANASWAEMKVFIPE